MDGYACVVADDYTNNLLNPGMLRIGAASVFTPIPDTGDIQDYYYEFTTRSFLELQSQKTKGIAALWNRTIRLPHKFNRAQIESAAKPIILGITALHVTNFEGTLQLKTTNASYVYLNPKAAETRMLEELYRSGVPCGTQSTMLTQNTIPLSQILQMNETDIKGKYFTVNGVIKEIEVAKDWHYIGCPTCNQLIYPTANRWFCPHDGMHTTSNNLFRIEAKIVDTANSIDATIFDSAATQLLKQTCSELLTQQNPIQELLKMENKRAQFHIHLPADQNPGKLKCIVNKAVYLEDEPDIGTSTPQPSTPAPKIYPSSSAKRSLDLLD
ncbi:hypothetical protein M8C21_026228, partial [Ambrosia artemisiifolia]